MTSDRADRSLAAKLRDVLSDETLAAIDRKAELDRAMSRQRDRGGDRLAAIYTWRRELEAAILPLLGSLQEEQMRELRAFAEMLKGVELPPQAARILRDNLWNLYDGSPTSSAEGEKE